MVVVYMSAVFFSSSQSNTDADLKGGTIPFFPKFDFFLSLS